MRTSGAADRRAVVRDSLAVGVATGTYGVSFGAVAVGAGLDVWQACALSLLMFTGASQFALVAVVGAGGSAWAAAGGALLLGTRNTLYGLRVAPLLVRDDRTRDGVDDAATGRGAGRTPARVAGRALGSHLVIDESTAVALAQPTAARARVGFWVTGAAVLVCWNVATLAGALAGDALGDPRQWGLDAAVGAAFLGLLWPRLGTGTARATAVLGAGVALLLVPLAPAGVPVLAAAVVALGLGLLARDTPGAAGAGGAGAGSDGVERDR